MEQRQYIRSIFPCTRPSRTPGGCAEPGGMYKYWLILFSKRVVWMVLSCMVSVMSRKSTLSLSSLNFHPKPWKSLTQALNSSHFCRLPVQMPKISSM